MEQQDASYRGRLLVDKASPMRMYVPADVVLVAASSIEPGLLLPSSLLSVMDEVQLPVSLRALLLRKDWLPRS